MSRKKKIAAAEFKAEDAAQLLREDLAAISAKVASGKTLSEAEIKRVRAVAHKEANEKGTADDEGPKWTESQVELGKILGIDRKTIQRHLKAKDCPGKTPDNRYNIHEWRYWLKMRGRKGGKREGPDKNALECQKLLMDMEVANFEFALKKSQFTSNRDIEQWFGNFGFGIKTELLSLPRQVAGDIAALFELTPEQAETARNKIKVFMEGQIREFLKRIADGPWEWRQQLASEKAAGEVSPAATADQP